MNKVLSINELVKAVKSVAPDKSNTVKFKIEAGKAIAKKIANYLGQVDMKFDADTSWEVRKHILTTTFVVTVGGVNSEVRKAVQDILKTVQTNWKA